MFNISVYSAKKMAIAWGIWLSPKERPFYGFFLFGNCGGLSANYQATPDASLSANYFENISFTLALVETSSLGDSGEGDGLPGNAYALDAVALTDGDAGDTFYFGAPVIGPDGSYFPAGARRYTDGIDTDMASDWILASFSLPGYNTPTGGGFDGCAPITLTIPEIQGDDRRSIYEGAVVTTPSVVTLIRADAFLTAAPGKFSQRIDKAVSRILKRLRGWRPAGLEQFAEADEFVPPVQAGCRLELSVATVAGEEGVFLHVAPENDPVKR
jgi:hypothetical protein